MTGWRWSKNRQVPVFRPGDTNHFLVGERDVADSAVLGHPVGRTDLRMTRTRYWISHRSTCATDFPILSPPDSNTQDVGPCAVCAQGVGGLRP